MKIEENEAFFGRAKAVAILKLKHKETVTIMNTRKRFTNKHTARNASNKGLQKCRLQVIYDQHGKLTLEENVENNPNHRRRENVRKTTYAQLHKRRIRENNTCSVT